MIGATVATTGGDGDILLSGHSGIVVNSDLTLIQFEQPFILNRDQYDNWHTGEPNNSGDGEDYGVMYADGTWNDASGSSVLNGYILELGEQFQFISGSFTWHQASYDAQSRGGRLAVLDSEPRKNELPSTMVAQRSGSGRPIDPLRVSGNGLSAITSSIGPRANLTTIWEMKITG